MQNYRKAFFLAAGGNLTLVVAFSIFAGVWWRGYRASAPTEAQSVSTGSTEQAQNLASGPAQTSIEAPLAPVQLSPQKLQSIGVKLGLVERRAVRDEIRATGNVAIDETRLSYVQTRFAGYIERVFADATYKYVRKGQPLFTMYSPELAAAEREYLVAKKNEQSLSGSEIPGVSAGSSSLVEASVERLQQWNISKAELARLESSGKATEELEIDSPASGYITERHALPNLSVQPDTHLYTIADLSTVWVQAQVYQNDLGRVRPGQGAELTVDAYPGRVFRGRVDLIYPDVDEATRTARVRIVFPNPNLALTPGMFVNVALYVMLGNQLVIPKDAVLQSGLRQTVFVDRPGDVIEPREVELGPQTGDEYIVLKGLKAGERIVTSANFLIDSESQLQAAINSFAQPAAVASPAAPSSTDAGRPDIQIAFSTEPATLRKGINVYRVKLSSSDGSPVTEAQVSVRSYLPGMPDMGMPAVNSVTQLAEKEAGGYAGQVKLEAGGTWQITVTAARGGVLIATKQFSMSVEGGM